MIPNLVKGRGITGAIKYALGEGYDGEKMPPYEMAMARAAGVDTKGEKVQLVANDNGRATILGGQNFGYEIDSVERVELARKAMEWNALDKNQTSRGRKCENDCLHATLSWEKGQTPTGDDMREAAQGFLKSIGMENAMAVFIRHDDKEHDHVHIVASRIDPETGRTISAMNDHHYAQAWALSYEREKGLMPQNEHRQTLHKIVDCIEKRDANGVADLLTDRSPTFTARELDKALQLAKMTPEDRAGFRSEILGGGEVVGLREAENAEVSRYTTRRVLREELAVLHGADQLAEKTGFGIKRSTADQVAKNLTLIDEQTDALHHLTDRKAIGILWGEAGTGKSHTLKAVRGSYEQEGFSVVGLSHTNKVVQAMRGDGFTQANTITAELHALDRGAAKWDRKTVVVVDEAAMVSTAALGKIVDAASKAGAKLILAGDDAQLGSIERGGLFETLRQKHGFAKLEQVQRVKDPEQQKAFNQMHGGAFRAALDTFAKDGGLHWSETQDGALQATATAYTKDSAADPTKRRFMIAATNAEVDALNDYARQLHKQRGDIGDDHQIKTAKGNLALGVGDRIIFTGNGYGKKAKNAGLVNGNVGTVKAVEMDKQNRARLTVAIDGIEKPISFTVGENGKVGEFNRIARGYAGTTYKSQGATYAETYVTHSANWRWSGSYVSFSRHKERVKIFASRQTLRTMDRTRKLFPRGQEAGAADLAKALDLMADGMARRDMKRAATAYYIDDQSFARVVESAVKAGVDLRNVAKVAKAAGTPRRAYEAVSVYLEAERQQQQRKTALQTLSRLFGREVSPDEGRDIERQRGGGQSL
ncbi:MULTISPECIES: AAA family ATPase [unclassified Methylobacterium]|uniref:AAA family ATPase n=1 Tax=unclassified Methylobacterium TaxID=2615210 RepID=UPI00226ABE6D|nr:MULTISPECIES: AAA family ATPase [unclassified Methylobacterium]